jgi:Na+/H+ antiporter NhaD/arsenite permease-like protein
MPMRQHLFGGMLAAATLIVPDVAHAAPALDGATLRWPWALPFIGILVTIATGPLLFPKLWHRHYGKLAFIWSTLTVAPLAATLAAISMGAVYMGAMTYIGNAPNFMVYAIAVERGVKMPSFFGYMIWSAVVLLPVLALLTVVLAAKPW